MERTITKIAEKIRRFFCRLRHICPDCGEETWIDEYGTAHCLFCLKKRLHIDVENVSHDPDDDGACGLLSDEDED